jgi:hypothetical protein
VCEVWRLGCNPNLVLPTPRVHRPFWWAPPGLRNPEGGANPNAERCGALAPPIGSPKGLLAIMPPKKKGSSPRSGLSFRDIALAARIAGRYYANRGGSKPSASTYRSTRVGLKRPYGGARTMVANKKRRTMKRKPIYWGGMYRGSFRRPRRVSKYPKFYTQGIVSKRETGNVKVGSDLVIVGHTNNSCHTIFQTVWMAIIKHLMYKAGIQVQDASQPLPSTSGMTIECAFKMSGVTNTSTTVVTSAILSNQTLVDITVAFLNALYTVRGALVWQPALPVDIALRSDDATRQYAFVPLRNALINLEIWSLMTIQNRTLAAGGTTTEVDESALSVTANPVTGKVYQCYGNGFVPTYQDDGDVSFVPLFGNRNTGEFATNAAESFPQTRKIPQGFFFGANKTRDVKLQPGEIKKDFIKTSKIMKLETFMTKFNNSLTNEAQTTELDKLKIDFGLSRLYAFEKLCNTRVDEPSITIGYEVNNTCKVMLMPRRIATAAYMPA